MSMPNPMTPATSEDSASRATAEVVTPAIDRAVQGAHRAIDRMAERVDPTVERLHSGVNRAGSALNQRATQISEVQDRWVGQCRASVRDNPLTSVALALLLGLLVGRSMGDATQRYGRAR